MSQFTEHGYGLVRNYIKTFTHIGLFNTTTQIKRVSDATVSVEGNTITYTVAITNSDSTLTGKTLDAAKLFESNTSNDAIAEVAFTPFTFESVDDTLTIAINIQIPALV